MVLFEAEGLLRINAADLERAVITLRGQVIRLISVRRSCPEEIQLYERL